MCACRTDFRCFCANCDMTAVTALPYFNFALFKNGSSLHIFKQCTVSFFMMLFNGSHKTELGGKLRKTFRCTSCASLGEFYIIGKSPDFPMI